MRSHVSRPYVLSAHAARVIAERAIDLAWVERTLGRPTWTEADEEDSELVHALARIPEHGGRVLRVIYNPNTDPWRVVTVYFDRTQRHRV